MPNGGQNADKYRTEIEICDGVSPTLREWDLPTIKNRNGLICQITAVRMCQVRVIFSPL